MEHPVLGLDAPTAQGWWVDRAGIRETLTAAAAPTANVSYYSKTTMNRKSSCIALMDWKSPSAFRFNLPREGS
jgi:hypothetical protein